MPSVIPLVALREREDDVRTALTEALFKPGCEFSLRSVGTAISRTVFRAPIQVISTCAK